MLAFLVVLIFFINAIVRKLLRQFYEILRSIRKVRKQSCSGSSCLARSARRNWKSCGGSSFLR